MAFAAAWFIYKLGVFEVVAREFPVRGLVLAVSGSGGNREALVQLEQGGEVKAAVPAQCVVFPGYIATIAYSGQPFSTGPKYTLLSATEKE